MPMDKWLAVALSSSKVWMHWLRCILLKNLLVTARLIIWSVHSIPWAAAGERYWMVWEFGWVVHTFVWVIYICSWYLYNKDLHILLDLCSLSGESYLSPTLRNTFECQPQICGHHTHKQHGVNHHANEQVLKCPLVQMPNHTFLLTLCDTC
jgi:hypothetical protein